MHTVHAGNVGETKTLKGMLSKVLARFPVERVILVADRGPLSPTMSAELQHLAEASERKLEFILAVLWRGAMPNSAARWRRWISTGLAEAVSPSSAWWSPTIRLRGRAVGATQKNASRSGSLRRGTGRQTRRAGRAKE